MSIVRQGVQIIQNSDISCGEINRQTAESLINKGKTQTSLVLRKMIDNGLLIVLDKGKKTKYTLRE